VDIVDRATGTIVYGSLTAPTSGDDWRVSTSGLAATQAITECYVRIASKANLPTTTTFNVSGLVTAVTHLQTSNGLIVADSTSSTISMDAQPPTDPVLSAATSGTTPGAINLSWTAASDSNGLRPAAYTLARGPVNAPAPVDCSGSGGSTIAYSGPLASFIDSGLAEDQIYAYRVCASDVVNNTSAGTTAAAKAKLTVACNQTPTVLVSPYSKYVKPGDAAQYQVTVTNNDAGFCPDATFTFAIVGAENSTDFITPSTFSPASLTAAANGGGGGTTLTVTAKADAAQGALNSFIVRVTSPTNPTKDAPAPVQTSVNSLAKMLHNSINIGVKSYGDWGTAYDCNTCHAKYTTNIKKVSTSVASPTGARPVVFSAISAPAAVTSGVFGNDHRPGTTSQNICEVCHHRTRFHQYSTSKIANLDHSPSSDCMKCHPHNGGFGFVGGAQCDDCHGDPPTTVGGLAYPPSNALGTTATNAGAHDRHNVLLMTCTTCHSSYSVVDNYMTIGFAVNNTNYPGFNGSVTTGTFTGNSNLNTFYRWTTSAGTTLATAPNTTTCNIYCHGWPGGGGSANATSNPPSWIGASQAACGTCHDATGLNPPTAGSHVKHAGGSGANNNIPCATCHGPSAANHGNGQVEWNLSAVSPSATYKGSTVGTTGAPAPTSSFSYGNCSLVYCHSSVQGATNPALGTGGPTSYGSPTWGDAPQVCGSCHRDMYSDPAATGGHVQHAQNPDTLFDCRICHSSGGTTNPNNHANTNIDVVFSGVGANTVYSQAGSNPPGNGYGNCSNSDCHGRQTTTWGPPTALPLCDKCHGSATTAAFYGTAGPGSTTLKTDKYVGAHDQHIKSAPYNYTTAPDCAQCHIKPAGPYSPGHLDTPLPAEITFSAVAKAGTFYGYTSLPAYNSTTGQCSNTWCHGAGMPSNQGTGVYGSVVVDGGTLGTPATPKWDQPFLTGVASNDCTRCHSYPPAAPTAGYTHYNKLPTDCNSCHNNVNLAGTGFIDPSLHVNGTIDGGCVSCHGNPPIDTAGLTIPALNALSPANAGGHNAHLLNPAIANNCYACHNGYTSQMPSNTLQMGFNAYGGKVTSGTFYGYSTLTNNVYVSSSAGTTVRRTNNAADQNTCASVYCHGGGTATKPVIGGGTNIVPGWEFGAAEVTCGTCHGVSTTSAPTAGSHARHALSGGTSLGLSCDVCHGVKVNNYHVNGSVEWSLKRSDSRIGPLATYNNLSSGGTGNIGPSAVFSSCSNLYCHSNVQGAGGIGAPSAYTTQQWGVAAPLGCAACHKDMASDASGTGSHPRHARTQGYSCNSCHNAAGSTTAKHADHSIDISFSGGAAGTSYTAGSHQAGSGAYGSCSASYCHSNVQGANGSGVPTSYKTTPAWGNAAALACSACHTDMTTSGSGTHLKHTASYLCATCHSGAGHDTTKHADGYIDVTFSGAGAGTTYTQARTAAGSDGYGTCSNIACHYNGSATWGGASLACVSCHPLATLQANGAHGKHISAAPTFYNYTANRSTAGAYDFGCSNCHPLDPLNNHANGSVNVTLNATNTGGGGNVGSLRARNNATADGLAAGNGPSGIYGTTKVSVRCSAAYCHSNGYAANLQYMITPDWYGPAYTGDKCAMCHGNSPNANDPVNQPGSPAHYSKNFLGFANVSGGHLRGIHTNQIFTGSAGLAPVGNTTTGSHGNAGTSTTINCNICHNKTVTSSANDKNMACVSCHSSLPKNPAELIADKRFHVSGNVDVAFASIRVKSKAQLRGSSYDAAIWSRQVGYKAAGAYDAAFKTFTTATQWDGATKTCSNISCHNGKTVKWGDTGGTTFCVSCHTSL
jgi:predicted CxxxxCH...CXXCH cytochrome family protein